MMVRRALSGDELEVLRSFARRIEPSDAGAYNNLGVLYYRKGLAEEAITAFSHALALDERMRVARRNLEIAYGESGTLQRRIEQLATRLANNPEDIEALVQSGIAEKTSGDLRNAQSLFERALGLDPQSSVVHYLLAETLYNRGLSEEALRAVRRSVVLHPENPDAQYLLGFILGDLGLNDEAADANKKALALNPTLTRAQANLSLETPRAALTTPSGGAVADGPSQIALGLAYRQKGYYDEAIRAYERAATSGSDSAALEGILELHLIRRDAQSAADTCERLVSRFPHTPKVLNDHGAALQMLGRHDEAEARYQEALALDEQYPFAHNNLGVVLWHKGDARGSVNGFRRALQSTKCPMEARLNLALVLFKQKHLDLALESYRQVIRLKPDHPVGWNGVGLILVELEKFEEARNAFARAIQSDNAFAEAHYNMSFTLSRLGDFNGALRETKQALALDPIYSAQKLALSIELPHEETAIFVGPALSEPIGTGEGIPDFHFDPAILEELFAPAEHAPREPQTALGSYTLARDYLSKGLLDRAHAEIARVQSRGGDRIEGLLLSGETFRAQGLHGEALERFNSSLEFEPGNRNCLRGSAQSLLSLGRADEALTLAEWLVADKELTPLDLLIAAEARISTGSVGTGREALASAIDSTDAGAPALAYAAELHTSLGEHARAVELLRRSSAADKRNVPTRVALARALIAAGHDAEAQAELRAALELDASNQDAQLELVSLYRRKNESRAALNVLVRVLHTDIYHFGALILLGETLLEMGRDADGRRAFERVIRFDPDQTAAKAHLAALPAEVG
ncbi:MAG: tetratricopeptide repeat protein [Gemmatimonadota bacterium]|nr:tetratricopeptide repeat protein [Gemmatimonadota bacterium]